MLILRALTTMRAVVICATGIEAAVNCNELFDARSNYDSEDAESNDANRHGKHELGLSPEMA